MTESVIWKISLRTSYSEVTKLEELFENLTDSTSMYEISSKTVEPSPEDIWAFEAYFPEKPCLEQIEEEILALGLEIDKDHYIKLEKIEDIDWVKKLNDDFRPINIGRFRITNLSNLKESDKTPIIIEATRAFGTGEHATTKGCMEALEQVKEDGFNFSKITDVGTGSGILAIAAKTLWPEASVVGSDIDPIAINIAKEHASLNNKDILCSVVDGMPKLDYKPSLIISNILAEPLINFASVFSSSIEEEGIAILSGFLDYQLPSILDAYIRNNFTPISLININKWITLSLQKSS